MLTQGLQQKLTQRISSKQIQVMNLIQLNTFSFEQRVVNELEENPALTDANEINYKDENNIIYQNTSTNFPININNYNSNDVTKNSLDALDISFSEHLINQLNTYTLNKEQCKIAQFLIGSIDSNGYLSISIYKITEDIAFIEKVYTTEREIEKVLKIIHRFNPFGVGARNLQECLLIQLKKRIQTKQVLLAISILEDTFDVFSKKQYQKIIEKFNISQECLKQATKEILSLNPKPGSSYSRNTSKTKTIIPDFTITIVDDALELTLNDRNTPELYISKDFERMLDKYKKSTKKFKKQQKRTAQFMQQTLDNAKGFIDAVAQRQQTLYLTMSAIMNYQKEYFLSGDQELLKSMILKDIADTLEMDISTISRVSNSKYVDTPYGIKRLKYFFNDYTINIQGEKIALKKVKQILKSIIANEKTPLTDQKLVNIFKEKGFEIPRRRIASYREQLNIPSARLRRKL